MYALPYLNTATAHPSFLTRIQSTPSPCSSSNSASSLPSDLDSPNCRLFSPRRNSEPSSEGDRRQWVGSMTSWSSGDGSVFKPPDLTRGESTGSSKASTYATTTHSPHEITTPNSEHDVHYFGAHNGNSSPTSSVTSTAHSKGGITPRAELPASVFAFGNASPAISRRKQTSDAADVDMEAQSNGDRQQSLKPEIITRRKHSSLDASTLDRPPYVGSPGLLKHSSTESGRPIQACSAIEDVVSNRRSSESVATPFSDQRIIAQSSATGCRISAPISPPAHYPGSAKTAGRRSSPARSFGDAKASDSLSASSSGSSDSLGSPMPFTDRGATPAPRWAHPPRMTNKISGRAWSFSQGQERPDIDFDPELFDTSEPDAVQEILKGMEGRIAVKTTPGEYNIMAWLPGFSIDDITISMKGDRTVQIVADLWDEGDHAQWNVLLGEDVNKSAISATFKGAELRVTVKRTPAPSYRSFRSASTSWSAPGKIINNTEILEAGSERPRLATYPSVQQLSH